MPANNKSADDQSSQLMMLVPYAAGLLGGALAGSYVSRASVMEVATSMDGALGAVVGMIVVPMVVSATKVSVDPRLVMYVSPFIVPAAVSMSLGTATLAVGGGALAGMYVLSMTM